MLIGFSRHFPVPHNRYKWVNQKQFLEWAHWYDFGSEVAPRAVKSPPVQWDVCISSDLPRAQNTAQALFQGEIIYNPLLQEVPYSTKAYPLRLPIEIWKIISRIEWWLNSRSQPEGRRQTHERCAKILQKIVEEYSGKKVLIVSHGFFMQTFIKEMKTLGFKGSIPLHPIGGDIHVFRPLKPQ